MRRTEISSAIKFTQTKSVCFNVRCKLLSVFILVFLVASHVNFPIKALRAISLTNCKPSPFWRSLNSPQC